MTLVRIVHGFHVWRREGNLKRTYLRRYVVGAVGGTPGAVVNLYLEDFDKYREAVRWAKGQVAWSEIAEGLHRCFKDSKL